MASGWFDNLRRVLGWWSAPEAPVPPAGDAPTLIAEFNRSTVADFRPSNSAGRSTLVANCNGRSTVAGIPTRAR